MGDKAPRAWDAITHLDVRFELVLPLPPLCWAVTYLNASVVQRFFMWQVFKRIMGIGMITDYALTSILCPCSFEDGLPASICHLVFGCLTNIICWLGLDRLLDVPLVGPRVARALLVHRSRASARNSRLVPLRETASVALRLRKVVLAQT